MAPSVCIGLAVTSNDVAGTRNTYGEFSDVVTTGSVSGEWKLVKVGICYSNDLDQLYAAVEDSPA